MKVKSEMEVAQSRLTLHVPMDCSLPGSSIHGIFQARVLEWVATAFSPKKLQLNTKHTSEFIVIRQKRKHAIDDIILII